MPLYYDQDAIHQSQPNEINPLPEKATPADADFVVIEDGADSYYKKKVQVGHLPTGTGTGNFGKDYQTAVSLDRSTTTSGSMQDKVTLTTGPLTGTYRVGWMGMVDGTIAKDVATQLYNVTNAVIISSQLHRPSASTAEKVFMGGFAEVVFTGAAKTFKIQFASPDGVTVGLQEARIELWRVS